MSAIALELERIVGAAKISVWDSLDQAYRTQISKAVAPGTQIECVVYPSTQTELEEVMACVYHNRWRVLPCGRGSKLRWGGLAEGVRLVISTARLNRLIEHAVEDLTVTAEVGIGFADLQATLAKAGQFLAIDPTYGSVATLGGIVATGDTGALRQRYGGIRDLVIGISLVRSDGQSTKAGGRVVKNVAGYDLMKLFTGSFGTLGIISQLTFRIYPLPQASQTVVFTGAVDAIAQVTQTLLASALTPTAVELVSPQVVSVLGVGVGIGLIVRFQSLPVSVKQQAMQLTQIGQTLGLQTTTLSETSELSLWEQLRESLDAATIELPITCKIGVLPSNVVIALDKINVMLPSITIGLIHAGSGLGMVRFNNESDSTQRVLELRRLCQSLGGFLTVLEAPDAIKSKLDIWGYTGNALSIMQKLKHQFDPEHLLSPHRFVGGI
jgi:glycolate oxidase FAD binding subunit